MSSAKFLHEDMADYRQESLSDKEAGTTVGDQSSLLVERMATAEQLRIMEASVASARNWKSLEKERKAKNQSAMAVSSTHRSAIGKNGEDYKSITVHKRNNSNSLSPMNVYTNEK